MFKRVKIDKMNGEKKKVKEMKNIYIYKYK